MEKADPQEQVLLIADRLVLFAVSKIEDNGTDYEELMAMSMHLKRAIQEMRKQARNAIISQKVSIQ